MSGEQEVEGMALRKAKGTLQVMEMFAILTVLMWV